MKPKLSLKILYRSPVRTILTFILLAAVTFALFSQVLEYAVASREMKKAVELYDGVGSVSAGEFVPFGEMSPENIYSDERVPQGAAPDAMYEEYSKAGYPSLTEEQMEAVSGMPYVTYTDIRYMTAGVTEFPRMPVGEHYYSYNDVCVLEAEVRGFIDTGSGVAIGVKYLNLIGGEPVPLSDFGEDAYAIQGDTMTRMEGMNVEIIDDETAVYTWGDESTVLKVGERCVFVLRYWVVAWPDPGLDLRLTDPLSYSQCKAVYSLEGEPENYLETEKFAPLREYIEIINADKYTQDVVYTKDMGSIRYFADGTMGISEGRAIAYEDTEQGNNVCVINHDFAQEYGLKIGDTISVDLGNRLFEQNIALGAIAAVKERMPTEYTTVELEIVGIFKDVRNKYADRGFEDVAWSYSVNTIFVPQHLLSVDEAELENHKVYPQEFSFVVDDAWDLPAFKEDVLPQIEEMGLTVYFEDGGFGDILTAFQETERIALIKIAILLFAIVVITWFVSMLYIVGRKRDYAVMRLLGTSKAKSARSMVLPLGVIAVAAVAVGSAAAYVYTVRNIASNASLAVLSGFELDVSVPAWVVLACVLGEIALTLILALILIGVIGRKSPLELMQANSQKGRRRKKKKKTYAPEPKEPVVLGEWVSIQRPKPDGKSRSGKFAWRYAACHIKRTLGKALMFVIVSALLINVAGQLLIMRESYLEIFEGTEVVSQYAGFLNLDYVDQLVKSGYVKDVYYCEPQALDMDREEQTVLICNNVEEFGRQEGLEDVQVTYLEGYGAEDAYELGNVIIVGEKIMAERGLKLGDTVEINGAGWYETVVSRAIQMFKTKVVDPEAYTDEEIIEIEHETITERYMSKTAEMVIIGSVTDKGGVTGEYAFTPGNSDLSIDYGKLIIPPSVEATLTDNWKAEEYREYGMSLAGKNLTGEIAFVMDTSKLDNVRNNIELMNTLYPVMVAAVLVIGAFLCGMLIIQTSKDIAIMRVLGTPKRRVRGILVLEQMLLGIGGVVLAAVVLVARGVFVQMLVVFGVYIAVLFSASLIASSAASGKSPLELLQTKE